MGLVEIKKTKLKKKKKYKKLKKQANSYQNKNVRLDSNTQDKIVEKLSQVLQDISKESCVSKRKRLKKRRAHCMDKENRKAPSNRKKRSKKQKSKVQLKKQRITRTCSTLCSPHRYQKSSCYGAGINETKKESSRKKRENIKNTLNSSLQEFFFVGDLDESSILKDIDD